MISPDSEFRKFVSTPLRAKRLRLADCLRTEKNWRRLAGALIVISGLFDIPVVTIPPVAAPLLTSIGDSMLVSSSLEGNSTDNPNENSFDITRDKDGYRIEGNQWVGIQNLNQLCQVTAIETSPEFVKVETKPSDCPIEKISKEPMPDRKPIEIDEFLNLQPISQNVLEIRSEVNFGNVLDFTQTATDMLRGKGILEQYCFVPSEPAYRRNNRALVVVDAGCEDKLRAAFPASTRP